MQVRAIVLPTTLTMPSTVPPLRWTSSTADRVSNVSPDWLTAKYSVSFFDDRVSVTEFGRGFGVTRNTRQLLDHTRPDHARDVCRAAAENLDPAHAQLVVGFEVQAVEPRRCETVIQPAAQYAFDDAGLLVDFLQCEVLVVGFVELLQRRVDRGGLLVRGDCVQRGHLEAAAG